MVSAVKARIWRPASAKTEGYIPVASGIVVHEASRLERRGVVFSLVVLTSGRESRAYGAATLRGATARVLGLRRYSLTTAPGVYDAL